MRRHSEERSSRLSSSSAGRIGNEPWAEASRAPSWGRENQRRIAGLFAVPARAIMGESGSVVAGRLPVKTVISSRYHFPLGVRAVLYTGDAAQAAGAISDKAFARILPFL